MTQEEKKRLEDNLRKSASRAKTGYVRIKTGPLSEDQGFAPIGNLPVFNPITNEESSLDKVLSHLDTHNDNFKEVSKEIKTLHNTIEDLKVEKNKQDEEIKELKARISSIEIFHLD